MTDFSDFKSQIMDWTNRQDFSDALVTSFIRMAEADFNRDLRVDRMILNTSNLVSCRCADLPDDWLQADLVRIANGNAADGFLPIRYKSRDEFFNLTDNYAYGYYTLEGRTMFFGGTPDQTEGIEYRMAYYAEVPVFSDTQDSWIYTKHPDLYLNSALYHAALHAVGEEQSAANFKALRDDTITKLNAQHALSRASGSRVTRTRTRSFG